MFTLARTIHYLSFPHHLIDSLEAKPVDIYSLRELDISISQHMHKSLVLWNLCCGQATVASCLCMFHIYHYSKRFKGDFSFFFISRLNMKNCGNFFNLTRKAKPVLSSINCTINVETCNISVHCWHTRLSFFIFVKKTS